LSPSRLDQYGTSWKARHNVVYVDICNPPAISIVETDNWNIPLFRGSPFVLGLFEQPVYEHTTVPSVVKGVDTGLTRIADESGAIKGKGTKEIIKEINLGCCPSFRCGIYSCRNSSTARHFALRWPSFLGVRLY